MALEKQHFKRGLKFKYSCIIGIFKRTFFDFEVEKFNVKYLKKVESFIIVLLLNSCALHHLCKSKISASSRFQRYRSSEIVQSCLTLYKRSSYDKRSSDLDVHVLNVTDQG